MANGASIENCVVRGEASLATTGASFGVGGICGFGSGTIDSCTADVTLVCRDLDVAYKDEQFMGGAFANGFIDLIDTDVTIRGFDSDHGYVHDGGLIGMHIDYVGEPGHMCSVTGNQVRGFITFFEDNLDRRAYCDPIIGECMSYNITREGNTDDFVRDERFVYDTDLVPHTCESPTWTDETIEPDCDEHGYTLHTCNDCGYTYQSDWTPTSHVVDTWNEEKETPGSAATILSGTCTRCGTTIYRIATAEQSVQGQDGGDAAAEQAGEAGPAEPRATPDEDVTIFERVARIISIALVVVVAVMGVAVGVRVRGRRS